MIMTILYSWLAIATALNVFDVIYKAVKKDEITVGGVLQNQIALTLMPITLIPMLLMGAKLRYKGKVIWPISS